MSPYINSEFLNLSNFKKLWLSCQLVLVCKLKLDGYAWKSTYFRKIITNAFDEVVANTFIEECDPHTFFEIVRIILTDKTKVKFKEGLPYAIISSEADASIDSDSVMNYFQDNIKKLLVLESSTRHYPVNEDKKYFANHFPQDSLEKLANFFTKQSKK